MLSQQNLIYLGIALLIVGIAFFAYQELQKHHTEIEKLRMQSQKLEKIIYAYNMRQWHQSTDPYLMDGAGDSDEESDSDESGSEENDGNTNNMSSFIRQTLNSIGTPAGPSKITISAGGKTMQIPVTPQIEQHKQEDDIPDVDTFEVGKNMEREHSENDEQENYNRDGREGEQTNYNEEGAGEIVNGDLEEMEQNDIDISEDKKYEEKNSHLCNVPIRTGDRKGEICGNVAKAKGMCLRHYRQENKIH